MSLDAEVGREASHGAEERAPLTGGCYSHKFTWDQFAPEANTNLFGSRVTDTSHVLPKTELFRGSLSTAYIRKWGMLISWTETEDTVDIN